jgi:hypothetical protein
MVDDSVNKLFGRFLLTIGATEATARVIHNAPKGLLKCPIGQSDYPLISFRIYCLSTEKLTWVY